VNSVSTNLNLSEWSLFVTIMHSCTETNYVAKVLYGQGGDILHSEREHLQRLAVNVVSVEFL
jgi:hypothetical protein